MSNLNPIWLSFQLAFFTSLILFVLVLPLSYYLAFNKSKFRIFLEALVSLPLVLPPTVIGFYLLLAFGPENGIGSFFRDYLGFEVLFSFEGLVFASIIYSLPFMANPLKSGFQSIPRNIIDASKILGKSNFETLLKVILPNMKSSVLTALVMTFAHTLGEFGVILMIGGNIPGETRLASIAIYDQVEALNYATANTYSLILIILSLAVLLPVYYYNNRSKTQVIT